MNGSQPDTLEKLSTEVLQHHAQLNDHEGRIGALELEREGFETQVLSAITQQRGAVKGEVAEAVSGALKKYQDDKQVVERRKERSRRFLIVVLGFLAPLLAAVANRLTATPSPGAAPAPPVSIDVAALARQLDALDHDQRAAHADAGPKEK